MRGTDSNVVGTISSPLFSHREHEGGTCSEFGCFTPFHGSALHSGVKDDLSAGRGTMMSQTISECTNESMGGGLRSAMRCEKGGKGREKQRRRKTFLRSFLESAPCPGRSHAVLRRMLLRVGRAQVDEDGRWWYVLLIKSAEEVRALCWEESASVPHWVQTAEPMS